MKISLFKENNKVMASMTGKNINVLIQAKKLIQSQFLQDPDFAKKCGDAILAAHEDEQKEEEKKKEALRVARQEARQRGMEIRNGLIAQKLITPRIKKVKK